MRLGKNYDIVIHRENGESVGYMCEWGEEGAAPAIIESVPPEVPVSTSSGVTQAGGQFTARDAAPPYPIEVNNWQDGAGQESYDTVDSSPEAFRSSHNIETTQRGHFELGPRVLTMNDWWVGEHTLAALGTFWASFTPDNATQPKQLRFMHRYRLTSTTHTYLGEPGHTTLAVADATDIPDLAISEPLAAPLPHSETACAMGDYLYCPAHNEVVLVKGVSGDTLTVERGHCGTQAQSHDPEEEWLGFNWTPIIQGGTPRTERVSALATDGQYVYCAYHNPGGNNGAILRGVASTSAVWANPWSTANNIVALCYCGGYLYGAQDRLNGVTSVGFFDTANGNAYTQISLTGAIPFGVTTVGLVGAGNYVYWVVTDGKSRSYVYRVQNKDNLFELVIELPPGFIATSALSHLGHLYIGGYLDNLATAVADTSLPRYGGALYLVSVDGDAYIVAKLSTLRGETPRDTRVRGLTSAGPYIYVLTSGGVYVYDTTRGAWAHCADTPTSLVVGETEGINWLSGSNPGFSWTAALTLPTDYRAMRTGWGQWDNDSDGFLDNTKVVMDESPNAGFTKTDIGVGYYLFKVNPGKYRRWEISGAPSTQATFQVDALHLQSQAACFVLTGVQKEVRVYLQGLVSGGSVVAHRVGLGYMTDPNGEISKYQYRWSGNLSVDRHRYRITFSSMGARVYVDDALTLSASFDELRNVPPGNSSVSFSVGWPGDAKDDQNSEKVCFYGMYFTSAGAYPPDYTGGELVEVGLSDISAMQSVAIVPVPGNGTATGPGDVGSIAYINAKEIAGSGWLELSDSALHMGSVKKYFTSVVVEHSAIQEGQTLSVIPIVDDMVVGSSSGVPLSTRTTASVNTHGVRVRVRVSLSDNDPARKYDERLRVTRITVRFFPVNSPHLHTYYLNCREGVQCRTGRDWGYDPEEAIRHLFVAADSGEVVHIESVFTDAMLTAGERQRARVESVRLFKGPGDKHRYDKLEGTCVVKLRRVDA